LLISGFSHLLGAGPDPPRLDLDGITREPLFQALHSGNTIRISGSPCGSTHDRCPFIEQGAAAIAWDGSLSPCLALMHNHASYLYTRRRFSRRYVVGSVNEQALAELWNRPEYIDFRQRVQSFGFSPCTVCGGCDLAEANEEDCYGNPFPTCGGCLWAQGVIKCP
jgi:MoaA/NifB/PqqE/SkfB family radical SAM enzyme